jgi:hypothetical protein
MHMAQSTSQRDARPRISSRRRAAICYAIQRKLALEYFDCTNAKREVCARMAIGLPPIPRLTPDRITP